MATLPVRRERDEPVRNPGTRCPPPVGAKVPAVASPCPVRAAASPTLGRLVSGVQGWWAGDGCLVGVVDSNREMTVR
jgi:hypothetical protein